MFNLNIVLPKYTENYLTILGRPHELPGRVAQFTAFWKSSHFLSIFLNPTTLAPNSAVTYQGYFSS